MLDKIFGEEPVLMAQGALDGLSTRYTAITDNIANTNTPGYRRKVVPFEAALTRAVAAKASGSEQLNVPFTPATLRDERYTNRQDGNNVDIEQEMAQLADNTLRYMTLTQCVGIYYGNLKMVITSK